MQHSALATSPGGSDAALLLFLLYTAVVLGLAWIAHRALAGKQFLGEYFLGSRSLGMLALALTFGATSASAGSFAGFPALVYTHGWVLALWIASYMIFPLCGLGLLGKRMNQVSRISGAITVPEVLRERLNSKAIALFSTLLMAFLLAVYLIPQFKLASLIMEQLLGDTAVFQAASMVVARHLGDFLPGSASPEYLLGLLLFGGLVVIYTAFGGFKAVVWTDVLQGLVMVGGVTTMLILALWQVGGLDRATQRMRLMTPPLLGEAVFRSRIAPPERGYQLPSDIWFTIPGKGGRGFRLVRTNQTVFFRPGEIQSNTVKVVEITTPEEIQDILEKLGKRPELPEHIEVVLAPSVVYAGGHNEPGAYVRVPGPSPTDSQGFLPLGLAVSFFVFWALSGTGQPGNMVRLMAFDRSRTLRKAIVALSIYFTLIYLPIVIIFCCARVLIPGLDQTPDRIMPVLSFSLTSAAGVPWLAGLLIAAPFAAAMSTVDSFLLMISSSLVRDVYQRNINPAAGEKTIKRMSYACTLIVGILAVLGAVNPPQFLQYLIVFTGGGLAVAFLAPVAYALYWPRFNAPGGLGSMAAGFLSYVGLYLAGFLISGEAVPVRPLGLDPLLWGFFLSLAAGWLFTVLTPPPPRLLVQRFFCDEVQ